MTTIILSRASEVGSPTNHLGSRQRQDTGPYVKYLDRANLVINYQKRTDRALDPFYLGRVRLACHNIYDLVSRPWQYICSQKGPFKTKSSVCGIK